MKKIRISVNTFLILGKSLPLLLALIFVKSLSQVSPARAESLFLSPLAETPPSQIPLLPPGVTLKQVILKDSTAIAPEQVEAAAAEFIGQNVTLEDLREIQMRLNAL